MNSFSGDKDLNMQLPVLVNHLDLEKYPEFKKLLKNLTRYVECDGTTTEIKREHTEVCDALRREKLQYLQAKVVYDELKELLLDEDISKHDHKATNPSAEAMKEALIAAELVDYLDFDPEVGGTNVTLLGLKAERLHEHDSQKMVLQQGLIPELENRLKSKCEQVAQHHETSKSNSVETDSKFAFSKAAQLPAILEVEKLGLEDDKKEQRSDRLLRYEQHVQYYQILVSSLETCEKLITEYKLEKQRKCDDITSDWLIAKCQALCLKIRVLQNQMLCDTYTTESVAALRQIQQSLQSKEIETKMELHHVIQLLQSYKSVGMGFEDLVQQYGDIIAEIDNKKWALSELRHNDNNDLNDFWK